MANPDLRSREVRASIVQSIKQEENWARKREHQKRFDVFRERQDRYIIERLQREFDDKTVDRMRKILSVNLTPRIINEMSSIYKQAPERTFEAGERELSDNELEVLEEIYKDIAFNEQGRRANQFFNLHDQTALMIVPDKMGSLKIKPVPPMHYDVIPDSKDPEKAFAYILNVWNFDLHKTSRDIQNEPTQLEDYRFNDLMNQEIADDNDRIALLERYIVWTADFHFTMNGKGEIIDDAGPNPIGRLPFIDIAKEKDFQFFVRRGTSVVDFALDFSLLLSDMANVIRLQGYAQGVISSEKKPEDTRVGPQKLIWLQQDPNSTVQPSFNFVSPNADINGSLDFYVSVLRMFLSSRGIDPKTISGKGETKSFSSGVERLLAMIDKFEASRSDFDLFQNVEKEAFDIIKRWINALQNTDMLKDKFQLGEIGDDVNLSVKFHEPVAVQTQSEMEDSVIKKMEQGLMSRGEAIQKLRDVDEEEAIRIARDIELFDEMLMEKVQEERPDEERNQQVVAQPEQEAESEDGLDEAEEQEPEEIESE